MAKPRPSSDCTAPQKKPKLTGHQSRYPIPATGTVAEARAEARRVLTQPGADKLRHLMLWRPGNNPGRPGYFLASWRTPAGDVTVSELFFAANTWSTLRPYLRCVGSAQQANVQVINTVTAWMDLPEPFPAS